MNYNPRALGKEFWLTPYYACILHFANIQQSLEKKNKGRANPMCELQLPSLLGNSAWLFQAVIQARLHVCFVWSNSQMTFANCPSTQPLRGCLFITDEFFFLHLNFTWLPWVVSRPWSSLFPAMLALCWAVETSRSSLFLSQTFPW